MTPPRTQLEILAGDAEESLAKGPDQVSDKQLLILILHTLRRNGSKPPWAGWRPRDIFAGALALLSALGVISYGSATAATKLLVP